MGDGGFRIVKYSDQPVQRFWNLRYRCLGIQRFETVFISHPNIDHFSMLADLIGRVAIDRIVVGESFLNHAREPEGSGFQNFY